MSELKGKPSKRSHFKKGEQQLKLLHQAGISNLDIKLSNVFYQDGNFYFIDFGYAKYSEVQSKSSLRADLEALKELEKKVVQ